MNRAASHRLIAGASIREGSAELDSAPPSAEIIQVSEWLGLPWLRHGFSTRQAGVSKIAGDSELNLGYTANDDPASVKENRRRFAFRLSQTEPVRSAVANTRTPTLITVKQMHSRLVRVATRSDVAEQASLWGDGLITRDRGFLLAIQTADCLPILIVDPEQQAVGAFHAGWRGTLKGIVQEGVRSMQAEFGSRPDDLLAAIGPGIGQCCFEVGEEIRQLFRSRYPYADELFAEGIRPRMDLVEANRRQLLDSGLRGGAIHNLSECTSCRVDRFFSYRAERGRTGRLMAAIGIGSV